MEATTNTGTTLIEESALIPGSLQFASEPWTFLYVADGIIRQLRKALGNKTSTGTKAISGGWLQGFEIARRSTPRRRSLVANGRRRVSQRTYRNPSRFDRILRNWEEASPSE